MPRQSWEKQSVWKLENGWIATVEYNTIYGGMISRLEAPNGELLATGKAYWHCSDGLSTLPDFARLWVETVVQSSNTQLVRPRFDRGY